MDSVIGHLFWVLPATFFYLIFDLYAVITSLTALVRSVSFWLLWLLFSILNGVAFLLFQAAAVKTLEDKSIDPVVAPLLILFFSTIGTFSIVQSFSLKFADYKAVDLEKMFEKLRASVLSEAASEKAEINKNRKLALARKLATFYAGNPTAIDQDYEALMAFGGRSAAQITAEIATAALSPRGKISTLANTMVFADERGARQFLP